MFIFISKNMLLIFISKLLNRIVNFCNNIPQIPKVFQKYADIHVKKQ